jgi:hypothetical protein
MLVREASSWLSAEIVCVCATARRVVSRAERSSCVRVRVRVDHGSN